MDAIRLTTAIASAWGVLSFVAATTAGGAEQDAPVVTATKMLEAASMPPVFPSRFSVHLHREVKYQHRAFADGVEGETTDINIAGDHERLDVAQATYLTRAGATQPSLTLRSMWDGTRSLLRQRDLSSSKGQILVVMSPRASDGPSLNTYERSFLQGFPLDAGKSIFQMLMESGNAVISGHDNLGNLPCVIVTGNTRFGAIKVWLNQGSGYRMERAEIEKGPGDLYGSGKLPIAEGKVTLSSSTAIVSDLTYEDIAGHTLPIAGKMQLSEQYAGGGTEVSSHNVALSNWRTGADAIKDTDFVMVGIANGTPVHVINGPPGDHMAYIWRDGKVVKDADEDTIEHIDRDIVKERSDAKGTGGH